MSILLIYILIFAGCMIGYNFISSFLTKEHDYTSLKTVTFGDESAVVSNRTASILSIIAIFLIWGSFTGSKLIPSFLHVPGAFTGEVSLPYEARNETGQTAEGRINVLVFPNGENPDAPAVEPGTGFAKNASVKVQAYRSALISQSDLLPDSGTQIVAIDGKPIAPGDEVSTETGTIRMTDKGSIAYEPYKGWQMEPIWLPAPESVVTRFFDLAANGYQNVTLWENLYWSLYRVSGRIFPWLPGWYSPRLCHGPEFMVPGLV